MKGKDPGNTSIGECIAMALLARVVLAYFINAVCRRRQSRNVSGLRLSHLNMRQINSRIA